MGWPPFLVYSLKCPSFLGHRVISGEGSSSTTQNWWSCMTSQTCLRRVLPMTHFRPSNATVFPPETDRRSCEEMCKSSIWGGGGVEHESFGHALRVCAVRDQPLSLVNVIEWRRFPAKVGRCLGGDASSPRRAGDGEVSPEPADLRRGVRFSVGRARL